MPAIVATAVSLAALIGSLALWVNARKLRRGAVQLRREAERLRLPLRRYEWIEWWTRNAAEGTPLDPDKPWLVRLAYVAALMPSIAAFKVELERVVVDARHPVELRRAASSFLTELTGDELPWEVWDRETGGRPRQAVEALAREVRSALYGTTVHPLDLLPPPPSEPPA